MSLGPREELSKRPFLSLLYSHSIATAVSLRKCSDTLPGHPEATDEHHEDSSCKLLVVALVSSLPYHPTPHRTEILGADLLPAFYAFSSSPACFL